MTCAHCAAVDNLFDERVARRELRRLERRGPSASTRRLLEAVRGSGAPGAVSLA